jgi:glycerol-3-phosphate acyltransferase PlsY
MIIPILIAVVIILLTRYVSLGSLLLGVTLPIVQLFRHAPWFQILFAVVLCVLIFYRHRSNIARLARGTETRFSLGRATGKRL